MCLFTIESGFATIFHSLVSDSFLYQGFYGKHCLAVELKRQKRGNVWLFLKRFSINKTVGFQRRDLDTKIPTIVVEESSFYAKNLEASMS